MPHIRDVNDYLRAHGWENTGQWRGSAVWTWQEFDVLVPQSDDLVDTPVRLRELLACVADAEGRAPTAVEREITMPAVDVLSYRVGTRATGGVALPVGVRAVQAVRTLVAGCARDATNGPVLPDAVGALLNQTLLSPAIDERFGVDVYLPVDADAERSLGRLTTLQVLRSAMTVVDTASLPEDAAYAEITRRGVAEDVCFALTDLAGQDRRSSFELGFRWSRLEPVEHGAVTVEFPEGLGERVRAGSRRRETERPLPAMVEGPVTSLSDDENGGRWRIGIRGVLRVERVPTGRDRVVPVRLDGPGTYEIALNAHREGQVVRAEGTTTRIGRGHGIDIRNGGLAVTDITHDE